MDSKHLHACIECDLLISLPEKIDHRHRIKCPRCHYEITSGHNRAKQFILALSITAIMILAVACLFPFISFSANGQVRTIGLLQAITELYVQQFYIISVLVSLFVLIIPVLYLLFLILIIVGTQFSLSKSIKALLVKVIVLTLPWSMAEVFLLGVLVALIKVIALADVNLETAFWAYLLFTPLFTYIASLADNHRLWSWVTNE